MLRLVLPKGSLERATLQLFEDADLAVVRASDVDYRAMIWINGKLAGEHEGGNVPIRLDITEWLNPTGPIAEAESATEGAGRGLLRILFGS